MTADWIPAANLALGVALLLYLIARVALRRSELPSEVVALHMLAVVLLVGLLVTSAQQIADRDATALEATQITAVKVTAGVILYRLRHTLYRTGTRGSAQDRDRPDREVSP